MTHIGGHAIDSSVRTVAFKHIGAIKREKLDLWLQSILWDHMIPNSTSSHLEVLRLKGVLEIEGSDSKWVVNGVMELFDLQEGVRWGNEDAREGKIVVIGRGFDLDSITCSFVESMK